jgi:bifunctional DNase/RNase
MVALKVKGFYLDQDKMPVAVLVDESGRRLLPVRTGPSEASAIIVELQAIRPPQPLAHDLLAGLFQRHGLRMERLEIGDAADLAGYSANIVYRRGLRRYRLPSRASDGLAASAPPSWPPSRRWPDPGCQRCSPFYPTPPPASCF